MAVRFQAPATVTSGKSHCTADTPRSHASKLHGAKYLLSAPGAWSVTAKAWPPPSASASPSASTAWMTAPPLHVLPRTGAGSDVSSRYDWFATATVTTVYVRLTRESELARLVLHALIA